MRAGVKAEITAREAMMAQQQARQIQEENLREIEALQQKLVASAKHNNDKAAENKLDFFTESNIKNIQTCFNCFCSNCFGK
jgi:alpha-D-ribose 1-methylphosphonate 5-triphosphate synthase subunit PhnG